MKEIPEELEPKKVCKNEFIISPFVEVKSDELFDVQMKYPLLGMAHAEKQCFLRKEVLERLVEAASKLPKGYKFRILDAWRPLQLQYELFTVYSSNIVKEFALESCTQEQKEAVINRFVSIPAQDRKMPPVHTTGGAVDLTILNPDGAELDMGTGFDEFTKRAYSSFYESEKNDVVKKNRRMLYWAMIEVGFTNLPSEWWHFDFGDRFWAYYKKMPAMYSGAFTKEELYATKR